MKKTMFSLALLMTAAALVGCSTTYRTEARRDTLIDEADRVVAVMHQEDPSAPAFLKTAAGLAVFPHVGKGGLGVGASYGKGVLYENGVVVGYCDIKQAQVGPQIGGQEFAQAIAFENAAALNKFKAGDFAFTANISAVAIKSGAAQSAKYDNGVVVFVRPDKGLMAEAAVGGQQFTYRSIDQVNADPNMNVDRTTDRTMDRDSRDTTVTTEKKVTRTERSAQVE